MAVTVKNINIKNGFGFKDTAFAFQWEAQHERFLLKLCRNTRLTHNIDLINALIDSGVRHHNDHKNSILEYSGHRMEVIGSACANDICLYQGLGRCARLITGSSTNRWTQMRAGTGTTAVTPFDSGLAVPYQNLLFSTRGFIETTGIAIKCGCVFIPGDGTATITESAVFDGFSTYLTRNMFNTNPISHIQYNDVFVLATIIELVPIV